MPVQSCLTGPAQHLQTSLLHEDLGEQQTQSLLEVNGDGRSETRIAFNDADFQQNKPLPPDSDEVNTGPSLNPSIAEQMLNLAQVSALSVCVTVYSSVCPSVRVSVCLSVLSYHLLAHVACKLHCLHPTPVLVLVYLTHMLLYQCSHNSVVWYSLHTGLVPTDT